jgi:hypothetical protein
MPKLSEIIKELAQMCFRAPQAIPSSEAAHTALLFAQVAWNRSLGHNNKPYRQLFKVFLRSNPNLWSEFRSRDAEWLIEMIRQAKEKLYPDDRRVVIVCGMRGENIHVEWCEEKNYPEAIELAQRRLEKLYGPGLTVGKRRSRKDL